MEIPVSDVMILQWPAQAEQARRFVAAGVACLLLIDQDAEPPDPIGELQDWERLPADERDIATRLRRLRTLASAGVSRPRVSSDGRLIYRDGWVALSPTGARLARALSADFAEVVTVAQLRATAGGLSANALRVHLTRLRRRIGTLGLTVHTARGEGLVMLPSNGGDAHG